MKQPDFSVLRAPLSPEEIEWKIISAKGGVTTIAPYTTARAVMERLDRAFGPEGWEVRYTPIRVGDQEGVLCSLRVKIGGEWVEKQDVSPLSDIEPLKGGVSGALKRAATAWGIGRELYTYPRVLIEGEHRYIPFKVLERLKGLPGAVASGKELPEVIRLKPDGTTA